MTAGPYQLTSSPSTVGSIAANGNVTYVYNGTLTANITCKQGNYSLSHAISQQGGVYSEDWQNYANGTLGASCTNTLNNIINALTYSVEQTYVYSPQYGSANRNSTLWASAYDWTCEAEAYQQGCLVTPWHHISVNHLDPSPGDRVDFADNSGNILTFFAAGVYNVPNSDIAILVFSEAVPDSITPALVFPASVLPNSSPSYWPGAVNGIPVARFNNTNNNSDRQLLVAGSNVYDNSGIWGFGSANSGWGSIPIPGDSGSGVYALVGGQNVFLGCLTSPYTFSGVSSFLSEIATGIAALASSTGYGGGQSLQTIDLSSFPSY